ncbi:FKBP-type peptidyl-prolyl cis-trans isomerase [Luteimonas sp. MJ293]|uniref:FKBP-type peptidyl-prolyl cis-trans isomerase n=1 Tax=Luteimonas sp. MJ146 TaxID=3129240 RepID=UPI0031BA5D30
MKFSPRTGSAVLLALAIPLALGACKKIDEDSAAAPTVAAEREVRNTPGIEGIDGLETAQQQAGYVIGLEMGGTLFPIRDEVDLDAMFDGIRDSVEARDPKVDEPQFMQIMQALGERMEQGRAEAASVAAAEGEAFLAENAQRDEVQVTDSGLQYEVLEAGEGDSPGPQDRVRVHYEGSLLNGDVFDSSRQRGEPAEFQLDQVVPGWQEGLQLMARGARYKFWIPAPLGYGAEGTPGGPIGPNATLVFDVELIDVAPTAQ